jgi:chemosensory pili system protein ChpA (sensor histidine kinase/response regulator)
MNAESTVPASLSPRAAVAMLSLQLRAAIQEADSAEADANAVDEAEAREQLRARLEPLIAERRRALDESLTAARADATEAITAARAEARRMIEEAAARAEARRAAIAAQRQVVEAEVIEPEVIEPEVIEPEVIEPEVIEPEVIEPDVVEVIAPDEVYRPTVSSETHTVAATPNGAPVHITVSIDAEAFATAFATVFVNLLEERMGGAQAAFAPRLALGQVMMMPEAVPAKPSFWSNARHLDVALVGLATTIVLLVLAAWLV